MRVLLISANRTEINMRTMPLGLASVGEAVRAAGHTVSLIDLVGIGDAEAFVARAIGETHPDVIGISIRNIDNQSLTAPDLLFEKDKEIIALARQLSGAPIVLGGAGYSMYPEAILDESEGDFGIMGEGEAVFPVLLERLAHGESLQGLPGVYVKGAGLQGAREFIKDPGRFPLPGPDLFLPSTGDVSDLWMPVQTRRGCSMGCSYCSTGMIEGTILRKRPVATVVDWLRRLNERGVRRFYFVDNTFNMPPSYAMDLCNEIAKARLSLDWRCIIYPLHLGDSLVAAMAGAGCSEVALGFESADDEVLKRMNKRYRGADVAEASSLLRRHGIRRMGFLMLGVPGETAQSARESLEFADSLDFDLLKVTVGVRIYPGTALRDEAIGRKRRPFSSGTPTKTRACRPRTA